MRILLVEDERDAATKLLVRLEAKLESPEIDVARSRDSAMERLASGVYDLVVCDLRIPPTDGGLDLAEEHGLNVASEARLKCPGTPLIFLTGFGTVQNTREPLASAPTADLYGDVDEKLADIFDKQERRQCVERIVDHETKLRGLDSIGVSIEGEVPAAVDVCLRRAVQIYARRRHARTVDVHILHGLSGAVTGRALLTDERGSTVASVFLKVGERSRMLEEVKRYGEYVQGTLNVGSFAPDAGVIRFGLRKSAALFYSLAEEYTESFFARVSRTDKGAIVLAVADYLSVWHQRRYTVDVAVSTLRGERMSDALVAERGVDLTFSESIESRVLTVMVSPQHGDLHGENILVNAAGKPLLIDFGDVQEAPTVLDAVTLEFSWLFHKASPIRASGWPSIDQAERWFDLDSYLENCPVPDAIRACREWATRLDGAAVPCVVYAQAVRQLKYDDVPPALALAIARGAVEAQLLLDRSQ